jgi:hypothetical protein
LIIDYYWIFRNFVQETVNFLKSKGLYFILLFILQSIAKFFTTKNLDATVGSARAILVTSPVGGILAVPLEFIRQSF